jgi:phage terminase small subunit
MAAGSLTEKQEAFALAYIETGNAAESYRRAYDVRAATKHSSIYVNASKLLNDAKISLRIKELQAGAAELSLYSVKSAYEEYEAARELANQEANPSAAVAAVNGKVKLFGLDNHTQKQEVDHTSSDGSMTPVKIELVTPDANGKD